MAEEKRGVNASMHLRLQRSFFMVIEMRRVVVLAESLAVFIVYPPYVTKGSSECTAGIDSFGARCRGSASYGGR